LFHKLEFKNISHILLLLFSIIIIEICVNIIIISSEIMGKFPVADAKLKKQLICRKCKTKNKVGATKCRKCHYKFLRPKKTTVVKK